MDDRRAQWGDNIKAQRKARGWTQRDLAAHLDIDRSAVSLWESGRRVPTDDNKLAIAEVFRVSPRTLFPLTLQSAVA